MLRSLAKVHTQEQQVAMEQFRPYLERIPVVTELALRQQMSQAMLLEYATFLLDRSEDADEVRGHLASIVAQLVANNFVSSKFHDQLQAGYNKLLVDRGPCRSAILTRFLQHTCQDKRATEGLNDVLQLSQNLQQYQQLQVAVEQWEERAQQDLPLLMAHFYEQCKSLIGPKMHIEFRTKL